MSKTDSTRTPGSKPMLPDHVVQAVHAAREKKADDLVVLDLRAAAGFTDYFVICSGHNPRHIKAIADAIVDHLAGIHGKPAHIEGYNRSEWVLLDYFDFIVHIFSPELRSFYALERLWGSAERIGVPETSFAAGMPHAGPRSPRV